MSQPKNKKLYNSVLQMAKEKFKSPSGIYRSAWIVKEYKKLGGTYIGTSHPNQGLKRWFREKWIDLNRPIKKSGKIIGYEQCGRKSSAGKYPLCRPSVRITKNTPKTYKEAFGNAVALSLIITFDFK